MAVAASRGVHADPLLTGPRPRAPGTEDAAPADSEGHGLILALLVRRSGVVEARWAVDATDCAPLTALSITVAETARSLAEIAGGGSPREVVVRAGGLHLRALRESGARELVLLSSKPLSGRAVARLARSLVLSPRGAVAPGP